MPVKVIAWEIAVSFSPLLGRGMCFNVLYLRRVTGEIGAAGDITPYYLALVQIFAGGHSSVGSGTSRITAYVLFCHKKEGVLCVTGQVGVFLLQILQALKGFVSLSLIGGSRAYIFQVGLQNGGKA